MNPVILTLEMQYEQDVVLSRRCAHQISELLGFDSQDQARLATAVSEIARNAVQYAGGGTVQFEVSPLAARSEDLPLFLITIRDRGPGMPHLQQILAGQYRSATGMGLGIVGSQRLMDRFEIESIVGQGTTVVLGKVLPRRAISLTEQRVEQIRQEISSRSPQTPFDEIRRQNQELLRTMAELRRREEELIRLNQELEDTNRGVVALYAELDEKAISLQKANELKTRFFSNMSHEFRTPLNSIISLSRLLLDRMDGDLSTEQEKQVILIQQAAAGLTELVNDLLDLAKVEAGKIVLHPDRFEVSDLFATLRGMLRPLLAHNSSVALVFEPTEAIPTLYSDEGKVAQILRNLISNALKFTERGEVRISAQLLDNQVLFSVADTGIGIAPTDQERIFEDFVQVDSSLQKKLRGTGLGLPLSRKLAELLGGTIALTSTPGQGSTFSVCLPIVVPGATTPDLLPVLPLDPDRRPLLVVEDQESMLLTYEKFLSQSVYQLVVACTLEEATQRLATCNPVAIVLDILLGEQHTWNYLKSLKTTETTRAIPILVTTVIDNEQQALALGADRFLKKPIERLPFLNTVNALVKGPHPQKVLLIDDEPAARYVLKQLLGGQPFTILEATNGEKGLALAAAEQPDAILLDLTMPGVSGWEVLTQLKQAMNTHRIPVIIHTSQVLEAEEHQDLARQTVAILSKAISSQEEAMTQLHQALIRAGIVVKLGDRRHV